MHSCARLFTLLFLAALLVPTADAEWVRKDVDSQFRGDEPVACGPGNTAEINVAGPQIEVGGETALIIDPTENCDCEFGLDFTTLEATVFADVDCDITVKAKLWTVDASDPACPAPLEVECTGPETAFSLTAGFNTISIPMDDKCQCADLGFLYAISYELVSATGLVTRTADGANAPGPFCTSFYIDPAGGVIDEANGGIPGRLGLSTAADCCNKPVDGEVESWGGVKDRFEN